eukprot:TRINITY_DN11756_c0_g1_i1.p1 TRINITY_DN11756_c0_g1~~TRINITY_DN11756_c0_g1_i1.p1  ORF type:complete len:616 (-),score=117.78 TRINITY_DN11756_c0_g1_i1:53-1900(-)
MASNSSLEKILCRLLNPPLENDIRTSGAAEEIILDIAHHCDVLKSLHLLSESRGTSIQHMKLPNRFGRPAEYYREKVIIPYLSVPLMTQIVSVFSEDPVLYERFMTYLNGSDGRVTNFSFLVPMCLRTEFVNWGSNKFFRRNIMESHLVDCHDSNTFRFFHTTVRDHEDVSWYELGIATIVHDPVTGGLIGESHYLICPNHDVEFKGLDLGFGNVIYDRMYMVFQMVIKGQLPNVMTDTEAFIRVLKNHPICTGLERAALASDHYINSYYISAISIRCLTATTGMFEDDRFDGKEFRIVRGNTWKQQFGDTEPAFVPLGIAQLPRRFALEDSSHFQVFNPNEKASFERLLSRTDEGIEFNDTFYKPPPNKRIGLAFPHFTGQILEKAIGTHDHIGTAQLTTNSNKQYELNLLREAMVIGSKSYPQSIQQQILATFEAMLETKEELHKNKRRHTLNHQSQSQSGYPFHFLSAISNNSLEEPLEDNSSVSSLPPVPTVSPTISSEDSSTSSTPTNVLSLSFSQGYEDFSSIDEHQGNYDDEATAMYNLLMSSPSENNAIISDKGKNQNQIISQVSFDRDISQHETLGSFQNWLNEVTSNRKERVQDFLHAPLSKRKK